MALLQAAEHYREAGRVLPQAQAIEAAGLAFAELGAIADARKRFTEAYALYSTLGAAWDLARMQATFRGHGIRRGPHASHRKERHGWNGLHRDRDEGGGPGGAGHVQPADRGPALPLPPDRADARLAHPGQAEPEFPHRHRSARRRDAGCEHA
jgi:hypothetical protein